MTTTLSPDTQPTTPSGETTGCSLLDDSAENDAALETELNTTLMERQLQSLGFRVERMNGPTCLIDVDTGDILRDENLPWTETTRMTTVAARKGIVRDAQEIAEYVGEGKTIYLYSVTPNDSRSLYLARFDFR